MLYYDVRHPKRLPDAPLIQHSKTADSNFHLIRFEFHSSKCTLNISLFPPQNGRCTNHMKVNHDELSE